MTDVTHFALVATNPKPRYRMKPMRFVPHCGRAAPTFDYVRAHAVRLAQVKGIEALVAVLAKFGAAKLSEVPPISREKLLDELTAMRSARPKPVKKKVDRGQKIHLLAEHIANGLSVKDAGKAIGVSYETANGLFQRMRRQLGPQAV